MSKILLVFLMQILTCSAILSQKTGGIAFRIDDNQNIDKYLEYGEVFNKYDQKFTFAINLNRVETAEYLAGLKKLQADGHEMMDHTPNHRTNYFYVTDPQSYEGLPGVAKVSGTKICVEHNEVDLSEFDKHGYVDIINDKVISAGGDFENFRAAECYLFFPELSKLVYVENIQDKNNLFIRDIWRDSLDLGVHQSLEYYTFTYNNVHLSKNGFKVLASESVKLAEVHGLERPKSWIQPGGYFPHVTRKEAKEACSETGFVSAGVFQNPALKVFNEYDPYDDAQFGMDWGNFMVYSWTLNDLKKKISDETAKHKLLIGSSHFQNLLGGWDGYLARLDSLLEWCVKNDIPIKTYEGWGDELYNTDQDPYVNIIPSFKRDINEDGLPDGIEVRESGEFHKSENSTERNYFSAKGTGEILKIRGLGGIEKGDLDFVIWLKGSPGNIVEVSFGWSTNKVAFPAESTEWKKYSLRESINGKTSLAMPDNYSVMDIVVSCSEFSSGEVQIGGMELSKLQPLKLNTFNDGGSFLSGDTVKILWHAKNPGNVNLYFSEDEGANWTKIASQISYGYFDWALPEVNSVRCLIKITDSSNEEIFDISDQKFAVYKDQQISAKIDSETDWLDGNFDGFAEGGLSAENSSVNFGEIISYKWLIDNQHSGSDRNLNLILASGTHKIKLICESDLGLEAADSAIISVFAKKIELHETSSSSLSTLKNGNLILGTDAGCISVIDSVGSEIYHQKVADHPLSTFSVNYENDQRFTSTGNLIQFFNAANDCFFDFGLDGNYFSEPSIINSNSIVAGTKKGELLLLDVENKNIKWIASLTDTVLTSPVISSTGKIYAGSVNGYLYKTDYEGETVQTFYSDGEIKNPPAVFLNNDITFGTEDGSIYKLNETMTKLWRYETGERISTSPVIDEDGNIYAGTTEGKIVSLSKEGVMNWSFETSSPVTGNPSLGKNGNIYLGLQNGKLLVLNRKGELVWHIETGSEICSSPIAADNNNIYFSNKNGEIFIVKETNYSSNNISENNPLQWNTYKGNYCRTGSLEFLTTSVEDEEILPAEFLLYQNYPNPFNPATTIKFALPERTEIKLEIFNVLGEKISVLFEGEMEAGIHKKDFDGKGLSSGIYLYRISSGTFNQTKKFTLMK